MLGQPQAAARSMPCWVICSRIHSLRARATASLSAPSSSGSRFSSRRRVARVLAQLGQHLRVVGELPDARRALRVVGHLLLDGELRARELLAAREVPVELLVLPHLPRAVARDEAGARVDERGAPHALREGDDVLRALDVRAQRRLERRVERHAPRRVDEHVDVLGDALGGLLGQAQVRLGDVAVDDDHLLLEERAQPLGPAVLGAQRIEHGRRHDALPEARLGVGARPAPHHDVRAPDLREAVEQHARAAPSRRTRCCPG